MRISVVFKNGHSVAIEGDDQKYQELRYGMIDPSSVIDAITARYQEKTSLKGIEICALQAIGDERWEKIEADRIRREKEEAQAMAAMKRQFGGTKGVND